MFCPTCGVQGIDGAEHCTSCGGKMPVVRVVPDQIKALQPVLPVNTSIMAMAAGYLGLFSLLMLPAPLALITGILALRTLRRNPGLRGHVRAWLGIVLGSLGTIGLGLIIFSMLMK